MPTADLDLLTREHGEAVRFAVEAKLSVEACEAKAQLLEATKLKLADLNTNDLEAGSRIMAGTARQMGIEIIG